MGIPQAGGPVVSVKTLGAQRPGARLCAQQKEAADASREARPEATRSLKLGGERRCYTHFLESWIRGFSRGPALGPRCPAPPAERTNVSPEQLFGTAGHRGPPMVQADGGARPFPLLLAVRCRARTGPCHGEENEDGFLVEDGALPNVFLESSSNTDSRQPWVPGPCSVTGSPAVPEKPCSRDQRGTESRSSKSYPLAVTLRNFSDTYCTETCHVPGQQLQMHSERPDPSCSEPAHRNAEVKDVSYSRSRRQHTHSHQPLYKPVPGTSTDLTASYGERSSPEALEARPTPLGLLAPPYRALHWPALYRGAALTLRWAGTGSPLQARTPFSLGQNTKLRRGALQTLREDISLRDLTRAPEPQAPSVKKPASFESGFMNYAASRLRDLNTVWPEQLGRPRGRPVRCCSE
ncbi:uncharacterized protein LOC119877515 [Canis lupus familiaris]|uniref:uncharacterized protein LOC119877515 n=1 Tax=Canis lupus familiaris TaxID=9615 RepID=UPI0018F71DB9|nr:uncharacterized protein LOC119877515 [Canis lupus familiaris]